MNDHRWFFVPFAVFLSLWIVHKVLPTLLVRTFSLHTLHAVLHSAHTHTLTWNNKFEIVRLPACASHSPLEHWFELAFSKWITTLHNHAYRRRRCCWRKKEKKMTKSIFFSTNALLLVSLFFIFNSLIRCITCNAVCVCECEVYAMHASPNRSRTPLVQRTFLFRRCEQNTLSSSPSPPLSLKWKIHPKYAKLSSGFPFRRTDIFWQI